MLFRLALVAIVAALVAPPAAADDPKDKLLQTAQSLYDGVREETLPNGLRVILHQDHASPLVAVNLWYYVGSKDEREGRTGFAHLFEHLMFMGSKHAPYPSFDAILEIEDGMVHEVYGRATELFGRTRDEMVAKPEDRVDEGQAGPRAAQSRLPGQGDAEIGGRDAVCGKCLVVVEQADRRIEVSARPRTTAWTAPRDPVLLAHRLTAGYGAAPVLENIDLEVRPGETVVVIGAYGAGKSTAMRAMSGLLRPVAGEIFLENKGIARVEAHRIAASGLALVPEGRQVFPELSVRDNLVLGGYSRSHVDEDVEIGRLLKRFPSQSSPPAGQVSWNTSMMASPLARPTPC